MENSAYAPNTAYLNSPTLVVFSQAAGGLQDTLGIQRPSQFTMSEASKDIHRPFTASSLGLMEAYSGIPAHILNQLQPQFCHPGLTLGSGPFRPFSDLKSFPSPSAFAPPKCLKIESNNDSLNHNHIIFSPSEDRLLEPSPRTDSCSPASASMSPQPQTSVKEESLDAQMSDDGEGQDQGNGSESPGVHEETRGFRKDSLFGANINGNGSYTFTVPSLQPTGDALAKTTFLFDLDFVKRKKRDSPSCPLCGLTISLGNLETHFMHELERLYKLSGSGVVASRKRNRPEQTRIPALPGDSGPEGRFETFQRIRANRQGRLRMKIRKRKTDDLCPICTGHPQRTQEEINLHVERCVKNAMNEEDETVDVESDFELDEWQESQRRRTNSLVGGIMIPTSTGRTNLDNEGDDVIVDGNEPEESIFGPSQYTENDVVLKENKDKDVVQSQVATVNSSGDVEIKVESDAQQCDSNVTTSDAEPSNRAQIINKLRSRIKQLESEGELSSSTDSEVYKCLICLENFKNPVISTVCWHVHCEECWLHTLGIKKVCPQCSMITSPTDLRRIFM